MSVEDRFEEEKSLSIEGMAKDEELTRCSREWFEVSCRHRYSYHFTWMGRPIIQYPQDMVALQEIVWQVRPDLIVETGIARGGSMVFYASLLELLGGDGRVVGIDIDIRQHNRAEIDKHPMRRRIVLIEGSCTDAAVAQQVKEMASAASRVLVILDSNHTYDHVRRELELYAPLVTEGSYLVVFDTVVEYLPKELYPDRPWGPGNNPLTAVQEFLRTTDRFEVDRAIDAKLQLSAAPGGYLKCVKAEA